MQLIDSHAHLFTKEFDRDRTEVMQRCILAGVDKVFLPNIDLDTIEPMLAMAKAYPETCFPMMGLHPCSVDKDYKAALDVIEKHLRKDKFYAVGEIGIDLYWDKSFVKQQIAAFSKQVEWAKELDLPIVIHVRNSFDEVFKVIDKLNDDSLRGIFHCFTGTIGQANRIIDYGGFKIGIGGVVTFHNSGLGDTIRHINVKHLVVETDAPYLAPEPHRGMRNESANVIHVARKLAEIYQLSANEIAEITTQNSKAVFNV